MYLNEIEFINFLQEKEITWIGIDFSKATFTKQGFNYSSEILQHFMTSWNTLIISDQKKYDIRLSLRKPIMEYDLSLITKKNRTIRTQSLLSNFINYKHFYTENEIIEYISSQSTPQHTPYALQIVVESFDAKTATASLWAVILKSANSETILCEKFLQTPGGIGTKNYWMRVFYNLFFEIRKTAFFRWENAVKSYK